MLVVITGGSGSGKSAYAEKVTLALAENDREKNDCYYLATMMVYGEEGRRKVERHKKLREGKGFITVEQPVDIAKSFCEFAEPVAIEGKDIGESRGNLFLQSCIADSEKAVALLECMSNLAANEMFRQEIPERAEDVAEKIISEIDVLRKQLQHLVIVTNNVFEDGISYEPETMNYIRALGVINRKLAERAEVVTEVAAGIPVAVKGEKIL